MTKRLRLIFGLLALVFIGIGIYIGWLDNGPRNIPSTNTLIE